MWPWTTCVPTSRRRWLHSTPDPTSTPHRKTVLATPNYGYEKRQRELAKKKKKEEKLKAKAAGKQHGDAEPGDQAEPDAPAADGGAAGDGGAAD